MPNILTDILGASWSPIALFILLGDKRKGVGKFGVFVLHFALCCAFVLCGVDIAVLPLSFLIVLFGYKGKVRDLCIIPIAYIIIALSNNLICVIVESYFNITVAESQQFPYYAYSICGITLFLIFVLIPLKLIWNKLKMFIETRYKTVALMIVFCNLLLCMMLYILTIFSASLNHFPTEMELANLLILVAYTILLLIVTMVILKVFYDKERMEQERQEYEQINEYVSQIESMYNELRSFKHDYINIIMPLSGYFEEGDYQGAERYYNESIMESNKKLLNDNFKINLLSNICNKPLKGLIASKLTYAHELGIDVFIDIMDKVENFEMQDIDLCRVMGVYIDNAVEAAMETETKEVKLNMVKEQDHIAIIVMNTFVNREIPLGKMETEGFSTKGENRGIGLYSVKRILSRYSKVYKATYVENQYFVQKLEIFY